MMAVNSTQDMFKRNELMATVRAIMEYLEQDDALKRGTRIGARWSNECLH